MSEVKLGDVMPLDLGNLPTGLRVYAHYLHLRSENIKNSVWKPNVSLAEVAKVVTSDVAGQWDKTEIPHTLKGKDGVRKVLNLLKKCQALYKIPVRRRGTDLAQDLGGLFDVAACPHSNLEVCDCPPDCKIPLKLVGLHS